MYQRKADFSGKATDTEQSLHKCLQKLYLFSANLYTFVT